MMLKQIPTNMIINILETVTNKRCKSTFFSFLFQLWYNDIKGDLNEILNICKRSTK